MSENLDPVRSIHTAWERGDFSSVEWAHSDLELVAIGGPDPGRSVGSAAVRSGWREFLSAWQDYHVTGEGYRELQDGRIVVFNRFGGRGKGSGLELERTENSGATVFDCRDGKVRTLVLYWDRERAITDLALSE
jgi:ketosteroid isomerase-like protein